MEYSEAPQLVLPSLMCVKAQGCSVQLTDVCMNYHEVTIGNSTQGNCTINPVNGRTLHYTHCARLTHTDRTTGAWDGTSALHFSRATSAPHDPQLQG